MRIGVLYDARATDTLGEPAAAPDVAGVMSAVEAVVAALSTDGHQVTRIAVDTADRWLTELPNVEVCVNLCEGVDGDAAREAEVTARLETSGAAFTGSGSATLALARCKDVLNARLAAHGVPVPDWRVLDAEAFADWHDFPAIVKPAGEDASVGIDAGSVVHSLRELAATAARQARYGPLLVQRFLTGREVAVAFVGDTALPIAELDFGAMPPDRPRIVSYAAKWELGSVDDLGSVPVCPAELTEADAATLVATARSAWKCAGGSGYGRVDLRADEHGTWHVLDVNPNPDLSPDAGLARMACVAGWSYRELVARIIAGARPGGDPR